MADVLTRADVAEIAHLARLALTDAEIDQLRGELFNIIKHMDVLRELDTDAVEPMTHAVPMDAPLRADTVEPSLPTEVALAQAPARDGDSFQVPAILAQPDSDA